MKAPPRATVAADELRLYFSSPPEHVTDPIRWWYEKRLVFPRLHRMVLDYLCIPSELVSITQEYCPSLRRYSATSVNIKWLFSRGRLILPHTRNRLSATSTRALMCLGSWSLLGLVREEDVKAVASMDEVQGQLELERLGDILQDRFFS